jgi:hypothetical protein
LTVLAGAWFALRPASGAAPAPVAPRRLAAIRAAVAVGGYAVVGIEVLSALRVLNRAGVLVLWVLGLAAAGTGAVLRYRRDGGRPREWKRPPAKALFGFGLALIALLTLLVATVSAPNNWDSQSYHLPKVEEWAQRGSVGLFPSDFFSQNDLAPGAEFLLLHLRLLTGGDRFYNLVQWGAGVLCALAVSRVAAQLGARRLGQVAAALAFATAPMVVLQASSTQTDLVASAWAAAAASLAVDATWGRYRLLSVPLLGLAAGLAHNTKATGALAAWPMVLLWLVVSGWRAWRARSARSAARLAGSLVALLAAAAVVAGPFLARMTEAYGDPLGPPVVRAHSMQRHDPPALVVNAARLLQTSTLVPWRSVDRATPEIVDRLADAVGVDPSDPEITELWPWPPRSYAGHDEDLAPYPLQVAAAVLALGYCLVRRWRDRPVRGYALACLGVLVAFVAGVKWQWYANRLLLPALVVVAPLVGLAAEALVRRARRWSRRAAALGLAVVVLVAVNGAVRAIVFGRPRALVGEQSVLAHDGWDQLFYRMPSWQPDYEWAWQRIEASGARRVGFVINYTTRYEYPLWVALRGRQLVSLVSDVPGHPAPPPSTVDAIVCEQPGPPYCTTVMPPDWTLAVHGHLAVALPPGVPNAP